MDWGVEAVAGTPGFRAPEAVLNHLSDVYSLGALLKFLMRTRSTPAVTAIAEKATRAEPVQRYPSISALLFDIDRYEQGLAVEAWSEPIGHRIRRLASRNAVLLWLLAAYTAVKFLLFFLQRR